MTQSKFNYVTYIRTTPQKLWHALTSPGMSKEYWFGMRTESEWKVGSKWRIISDDGTLMDSGEILESIPSKKLAIRWLNEWKPELKAEGESRCVCEIEPTDGAVKLTITHSMERANSQFIAAVTEGWPMIVSNLKSLLETGEVALTDHPGHEE